MPLPVPIPAFWTNQLLELYHGTLDVHANAIIQNGVDVTLGKRYTDFGRGFYTATVQQQARSWAWQLSQNHPHSAPAVVQFSVDRDVLAALDGLWFVRGSFDADDYWSLVFHCRRGQAAHGRAKRKGWYDIVVGPVATSWRTRLSFHDTDQIGFHTNKGAKVLNASNPKVLP